MNSEIFGKSTIPVLEQVLNFTQTRHAVLAGNVANMDTPGYKVQDLSVDEFQTRLKDALEHRTTRTPAGSHATFVGADRAAMRDVSEQIPDLLHHDESNVSIEQQVLQLSKNQGLHNMAIAILNQQFRQLNVAISERV